MLIKTELYQFSSLPSHIATMLKSKDSYTIVGGVQMAHILMEKLPDIFLILFHREGVVYEVKALRDSPPKLLPTPRKADMGKSPLVSGSPLAPPTLPSSASSRRFFPGSSEGATAMAQTTPPGPSHSSTTSTRKCVI